MTIFVLAPT